MNCPKCGARLLQGAVFCGRCGHRLRRPTSAGVAAPPPAAPPASGAPGHGIHIDEDSRGQGRGYRYEVLHQPAFSLAVIQLQAEQSIQAEAGAMVSMSANVELAIADEGRRVRRHQTRGGRRVSFCFNVSLLVAGQAKLLLRRARPGDIAAIELNNQSFFVQSSSYLAGDASLTVDTKWGGAKSFFGGEGLFVMLVQGRGLLLVSSFGAIHRKDVATRRALCGRYRPSGRLGRNDAIHFAQSGGWFLPQHDERRRHRGRVYRSGRIADSNAQPRGPRRIVETFLPGAGRAAVDSKSISAAKGNLAFI